MAEKKAIFVVLPSVALSDSSEVLDKLKKKAALLPNARHVEGNVFGSIGSGLAIEAKKRYG